MPEVLVVFYSRHGSVAAMADQIATGVESVSNCEARIRCVAEVAAINQYEPTSSPTEGPPYATIDDLRDCDALIIGSPSYFGNMAAPLKYFLDQSSPLWLSGAMIGKPAAVFSSASSLHGGLESVLTSMMIPLLHHGMLIAGLPYSESVLHSQTSAAAPYGATHVAADENGRLTEQEIVACRALGKRVAEISTRLQ